MGITCHPAALHLQQSYLAQKAILIILVTLLSLHSEASNQFAWPRLDTGAPCLHTVIKPNMIRSVCAHVPQSALLAACTTRIRNNNVIGVRVSIVASKSAPLKRLPLPSFNCRYGLGNLDACGMMPQATAIMLRPHLQNRSSQAPSTCM
jgi:hypothetical protein